VVSFLSASDHQFVALKMATQEVQQAVDGLPGTIAAVLDFTVRDGFEQALIDVGAIPKLLAMVSHRHTPL
jgi:hypothetical protein